MGVQQAKLLNQQVRLIPQSSRDRDVDEFSNPPFSGGLLHMNCLYKELTYRNL
jgi:hypothetical protein